MKLFLKGIDFIPSSHHSCLNHGRDFLPPPIFFFYTQCFYLNSQTNPAKFFFFFLFSSSYTIHFFFITIHCRESWPSSSFVVMSSLAEAHCYGGSLASGDCDGGWCYGVTVEVNLFFFSTLIFIHTYLQSV